MFSSNFDAKILEIIREGVSQEYEELIAENKKLKKQLDIISHIAKNGMTSVTEVVKEKTYTPNTVKLDVKNNIHLLEKRIKDYFMHDDRYNTFLNYVKKDNIKEANGIISRAFKPEVHSGKATAECLLYAHSYRMTYFPNSVHADGSIKSLRNFVSRKRLSVSEIKDYIPSFTY